MKKFVKIKWIFLIFVALIVGVIYFLPNILIPYFLNLESGITTYSWRDMGRQTFEEMFSYGVSIRDVIDGHFGGGDPYLFEYKNMAVNWDYYPLSLFIGLFFKLFHLNNLELFFVIGDFIFPPISFLIIFFLFFKITKNYLLSIFSSLIFLFFPNFFVFTKLFSANFYYNFSINSLINLFSTTFNANFSRLFVPGLSMIFLNLFLLSLYSAFNSEIKNKKWIILSGIFYGLLFYIYFYYWIFITISLSVLGLLFLFFRKKDFLSIVRIFIYGIVVAIPYWIKFFILSGNPIFNELKERVGLLHGRIFISPGGAYWLILIIFIFFAIIFWRRIKQDSYLFFYILSFLLSIFAVRNLQIIFGFNPQPDHWGSRIGVYIIVFTILILFFWLIKFFLIKYKTSLFIVLLVSSLFLLIVGISSQITEAQNTAYLEDMFFIDSDVLDSFDWINNTTEVDSVFITNSALTLKTLPFYTHANVYLPNACLSLAPNNEIEDRYLSVYKIFGVSADFLQSSFLQEFAYDQNNNFIKRRSIDNYYPLFCSKYQLITKNINRLENPPEYVIDGLISRFNLTSAQINNLPYRADYLFYGLYEKLISNFNPEEHNELILKYSNNSVKIYKIEKKYEK